MHLVIVTAIPPLITITTTMTIVIPLIGGFIGRKVQTKAGTEWMGMDGDLLFKLYSF